MTINPPRCTGEYREACRIGIHPSASHAQWGRMGSIAGEGVPAVGRIVIIGGGPAGYEAALVAAQLGAEVTVVEAEGAGGACVLHDCVPSKTFIASSEVVTGYSRNEQFGVHADLNAVTVDAAAVNARVKRLALAQSADIQAKLIKAGVTVVTGRAR